MKSSPPRLSGNAVRIVVVLRVATRGPECGAMEPATVQALLDISRVDVLPRGACRSSPGDGDVLASLNAMSAATQPELPRLGTDSMLYTDVQPVTACDWMRPHWRGRT